MGGYGSGRTSNKIRAEDCWRLDVNRFKRAGCLVAGASGNWRWSDDGRELARIGWSCQGSHITLSYRVRDFGGEWESVRQTVGLTHLACNYGGARLFFRCPGNFGVQSCNARVTKLYAGGRYFLCRNCYRIGYASQSEDRYQRSLRKANKLRTALGGEPGAAHFIAQRPKGMWQRTYDKIVCEIYELEDAADALFLERFGAVYRDLICSP